MAARSIVERLRRAAGFVAIAAVAMFFLQLCHAPVPDTLAEVPSPDGARIAVVKMDDDGDDYVAVRHPGELDPDDPLIWLRDRGGPGLLIRWRGSADLDIAFPADLTPEVVRLEKAGVHLRLVPYPDQPALQEEFERVRTIDPYPRSTMAAFQRRRELIDGLVGAAIHRLATDDIRYELSKGRNKQGTRWCGLGFVSSGGRVATELSAVLAADINDIAGRALVSFRLVLGIHGIRDPALLHLTVTGAQIIGDGFATSMSEAGSSAVTAIKPPVPEGRFSIALNSQSDLEGLLAAFKQPYKLAFLWDLPDTVVTYDVNRSPSPESLASFFQCVGDATPVHEPGEEFKPFYRSAQ